MKLWTIKKGNLKEVDIYKEQAKLDKKIAFKRGRGAPRQKARRAKSKAKFSNKKRKFNKMHSMMQLARKVNSLTTTIETKSGTRQLNDGQE